MNSAEPWLRRAPCAACQGHPRIVMIHALNGQRLPQQPDGEARAGLRAVCGRTVAAQVLRIVHELH